MDQISDADSAFVGAFGLVKTNRPEYNRYLALDDGIHLDLIRADRGEGETFKSAMDREVADQLGLRYRKDYIVSAVPRIHLNSRLCGSVNGVGEDSARWYICEFFIVNLYGRQWQDPIEQNADIRWLTPREIVEGRGHDGKPLKPDIVELMKIGDVFAPNEINAVM